MDAQRLEYDKLSPEAHRGLLAVHEALNKSPLGKTLVELVYLRVSQINGCAFCLEMHSAALRAAGVPAAKLDAMAGWRVSGRFDQRERAALAWAEALTDVAATHAPDEAYEPLKAHFSEVEISDLGYAIALMNAFNRLAIGARR